MANTKVKTPIGTKELKKSLKDLPKDKQEIGLNLLNEIEFMQVTLVKLKLQVEQDGATTVFKQGKQQFLREHPALKSYNTLISRYNLLFKQIIDLLPKDTTISKDKLMDFIQ